jgi:hypothetical protein
MKIAQIAPLYESVPPRYYGGTERVVACLCDTLVDLGHDVTLFAAQDAQTKARLISTQMRYHDTWPSRSEGSAGCLPAVGRVWTGVNFE